MERQGPAADEVSAGKQLTKCQQELVKSRNCLWQTVQAGIGKAALRLRRVVDDDGEVVQVVELVVAYSSVSRLSSATMSDGTVLLAQARK